jgi:hypothetical protein
MEDIMAEDKKSISEQKAVEKQIEEKFIIKERIKDIKDKPEKYEYKEKPEKHEVKEKPEKYEHKEKPEKHEFKEKEFLKEVKVEQLEKDVREQFPSDPGGPVEERLAALEQAFNHFIASGQRPDLSRGALAAEREAKK